MAGPLILIIEDEHGTATLLTEFLELRGYRTHWAKDGHDGLEQVDKLKPSLIMLDHMIPGMEGAEVLDRVKSQPSTCDIPVLICTAGSASSNKDSWINRGAHDVLYKPFDFKRVQAALLEILGLPDSTQPT